MKAALAQVRGAMPAIKYMEHTLRGCPTSSYSSSMQGVASKSRGGKGVSGQQLELDLALVIRELQRSEDKVSKEAKEWEARARERADVEAKLKRKLSSYPKRFMQNPEEVRKEVRALEVERDQLEAAAREERAGLFEELQALRTELGVQDSQLRSVEQELLETEADRDFWLKRYQKEKVRNDMLVRNRASLLERVRPFHDGKGLEKVAYDRVQLAVAEGAGASDEAYAEAVANALSPLLEPEVSVSAREILEYVRMVVAMEGEQRPPRREGMLSFERFCALVAQLEGKDWQT